MEQVKGKGKRKSKKIGMTINGYTILDSKHVKKDCYYLVKCNSCGVELWKSSGFVKGKAKCPACGGGRIYHNAGEYCHERLYERYTSILRRTCGPVRKKHYEHVEICQEWKEDYTKFREWALSHGYADDLTIDRIDNNKGYSPDNCRWATVKEQANNRSSNVVLEYEGKKFTLSQFADYVGISRTTAKTRYRSGWSVEDIAKTPYRSRKKWSELHGVEN